MLLLFFFCLFSTSFPCLLAQNILGVVLILEDWKTSTQVLGTIYDLDHGLVASLDFPGHVTTTSREELDDQFLIKKASESPLIKVGMIRSK